MLMIWACTCKSFWHEELHACNHWIFKRTWNSKKKESIFEAEDFATKSQRSEALWIKHKQCSVSLWFAKLGECLALLHHHLHYRHHTKLNFRLRRFESEQSKLYRIKFSVFDFIIPFAEIFVSVSPRVRWSIHRRSWSLCDDDTDDDCTLDQNHKA